MSRRASSARGTLTTATTAAVASAPNARRSQPSHFGRWRSTGLSSTPSNFRSAASIASFRAAGRGGGGSGSESRLSLSIATYVPSRSTFAKLITTISSGSKARVAADAKRVRAGGRKPLAFELRHRPGVLRRPHELEELGPVPELVRPA